MKNRGRDEDWTNPYAFCEHVQATSHSPWHIRKLGARGLRTGGGADTLALCGREVHWDLTVELTEHHLTHCCQRCAAVYNEATKA